MHFTQVVSRICDLLCATSNRTSDHGLDDSCVLLALNFETTAGYSLQRAAFHPPTRCRCWRCPVLVVPAMTRGPGDGCLASWPLRALTRAMSPLALANVSRCREIRMWPGRGRHHTSGASSSSMLLDVIVFRSICLRAGNWTSSIQDGFAGHLQVELVCTIDRMITVTPLPPETKRAGQASTNARISGRSTRLTHLDSQARKDGARLLADLSRDRVTQEILHACSPHHPTTSLRPTAPASPLCICCVLQSGERVG